MQKNICKVLSCLLAIIMVMGMIPMTVFADEVRATSTPDVLTATDSQEPVGDTYAISTDLQIDIVDGAYDYISFEYQVTNDGVLFVGALSPDWGKYYGYYEFNTNGKVWEDNGVYCENIGNGFYRVTLQISELDRTNNAANTNNRPETIGLLYIGGSNTATGTIRNVQYGTGSLEPVIPEDAMEITTGMGLDVVDGTYSEISFEYMVTNDGVLYIAALSPDWSKYYGYYEFNVNGKVWEDNGVYCELLDNGFYRVTLKAAEMDRTNNAANADNRPEIIDLLYIGGSNTATGYIRNVQVVENVAEELPQGYWVLSEDKNVEMTLTEDLYVDLNGHNLTGTIHTNGFKVYGMDTATNNYTCETLGYFSCVDAEGNAIVPESNVKTDLSGSVMCYVTIATDSGYTFHRIYVGITKQSLAPQVTGVGYKAEFYADEMVQAQVGNIGYDLWLEGYPVVSRDSAFKNQLTLRVKNFDAANYGETNLYATVWMTIGDETITSTEYSLTLREMVETVNAQWANYSTEQKVAVQEMVNANLATMTGWEIENIINWAEEAPSVPEDALEIATDMELDVVDGAYDYISFEYQVTNDGVLFIAALSPDWGKYYGYYEFNANGKVWEDNGVYCENIGNGFYRVTLQISELDRTNNAANTNNRPETIGLLYIGGSNTATGTIRNVQYGTGSLEPVIPEDAMEITTGMELDVTDGTYSEISFEYKVTNDGVLHICALSPDWGKYYGYYEFNVNGKVWEDNGVYCELLDNGFYRVTLKTAEMDRTNNAANADNRPDIIGLLLVGGNNTATGYIRNVQYS